MQQPPPDLVVVGRLTAVYGVRGWVKLHSYTEPMDNILGFRQLWLQRDGHWQPLVLEQVKRHQKGLVAQIEGVDDREVARSYCQCDLAVAATEMPALQDGDYYWHQLEGLAVVTTGTDRPAEKLGSVSHLLETGANDVLVVQPAPDSIDDRERLIPWLPGQVVKNVDIAGGSITVDWDSDF